ncbi:MAG: FeoA family protein [Acidobacteriota bacterium]
MDRLDIGVPAKVAYVSARNYRRIQMLSSLGILPGIPVRVHQRYPSFVIQCEETQIALEEEIARDIYVWRE